MSVKEVIYYQVECDYPGCTVSTDDTNDEYSAWSDAGTAVDDWTSGDHQAAQFGDTLVTLCERHHVDVDVER